MSLPNFLQGFEIADKKSLDCYNDIGLPTKKNENWHYLDMARVLSKQVYQKQLNDNHKSDNLFDAIKISVVNGNIGSVDNLPEGISITVGDGKFSDELINEKKHPLLLLNNAISGDFINIDISQDIKNLIHIDYYNNAPNVAFLPKVVIRIASGKTASIIETFNSGKDCSVFCNSLTEIFVEEEAKLLQYKIQQDMGQSKHIAYTKAYIQKESFYEQNFACFNNEVTRNEVEVDMLGTDANAEVRGVYIGKNKSVIDNTIRINHLASDCESQQLFKGVLNDRAQGIFQGKIYVDKEAQKTDGYQMHRSILLSDDAQVCGKPELEIYADDVKCSHGSSTGEINPEQLFYLTARGINENLARNLLLQAFLNEVFDNIENDIVRKYLQKNTIKTMETIL